MCTGGMESGHPGMVVFFPIVRDTTARDYNAMDNGQTSRPVCFRVNAIRIVECGAKRVSKEKRGMDQRVIIQ